MSHQWQPHWEGNPPTTPSRTPLSPSNAQPLFNSTHGATTSTSMDDSTHVSKGTRSHNSDTVPMPPTPTSLSGIVAPPTGHQTRLSTQQLLHSPNMNHHAHTTTHQHDHVDEEEEDADEEDGEVVGVAASDKMKRGHGSSCHQCKTTKDPQFLFFCTNKAEKGVRKRRCRKKYCDSCLKRSYGNDLSELVPGWQCPSCLSMCICAACHRKSTRKGSSAPVAPAQHGGDDVSDSVPATNKRASKGEKKAEGATPRQTKRNLTVQNQLPQAAQRDEQALQQQGEHGSDPSSLASQPYATFTPNTIGQTPQPNLYLSSPFPLSSPTGGSYNLSTYPNLDQGLDLDQPRFSGFSPPPTIDGPQYQYMSQQPLHAGIAFQEPRRMESFAVDEDETYSHSHRQPTMCANGMTPAELQAHRHAQDDSPEEPDQSKVGSVSQSRSHVDLTKVVDGMQPHPSSQPHPGSMSTPSQTRTISGGALQRLSISPLTIARRDSVDGGASTGPNSHRSSPRFSARSHSGKGNSTGIVPHDGEEPSAAELEHLMQHSHLAGTSRLVHPTGNPKGSSPLSGSPRTVKRKLAATVAGNAAAGVDISSPNQHVKFQMVARLRSHMHDSGASPTLPPASESEDIIARSKALQNQQRQLKQAIKEEQARLDESRRSSQTNSPSNVKHELSVSIKNEDAQVPFMLPVAPSSRTPPEQRRCSLPSPLTQLSSPSSSVSSTPSSSSSSGSSTVDRPYGSVASHVHDPRVASSHQSSSGLAAGLFSPASVMTPAPTSPSVMLNLPSQDSTVASGGLFNPPAPMYPQSSAHLMPGGSNNPSFDLARTHTRMQSQDDFMNWGGQQSVGGAGGSSSIGFGSSMPSSPNMNFPTTPGMSGGLFSPTGMGGSSSGLVGTQSHGNGPLFSPMGDSSSLMSPNPYGNALVYPSSLGSGSAPPLVLGSAMDSTRQFSMGGSNVLMGSPTASVGDERGLNAFLEKDYYGPNNGGGGVEGRQTSTNVPMALVNQ